MQRLPVDSSDLVSVGYDPKTRVLEIEFKEQRTYQYQDVPPDVYERFTRADSYGAFFDAFISGHYRYVRLDQTQAVPKYDALAFVTGNARKFRELQAACQPFGIETEQLDLPVDEIQSHDGQKIALHKAKQAYKLAGRPVVVNDTFWNILALRGFPGGYMRHVADWLRPEDFLALLEGKADRTVCASETSVYYDGKHSKIFSKDYWGTIIDEPRGGGQSICQIVVLDGADQTIAELEASEAQMAVDPAKGVWHDFAKWYNLQRRLKKV